MTEEIDSLGSPCESEPPLSPAAGSPLIANLLAAGKLLLVLGLLTGAGYWASQQQQASASSHYHRGVVVDKFEPRDSQKGPVLVLDCDSLRRRLPVRVNWTRYVNAQLGDSLTLLVRDKDLEYKP